MEVEELYKEVSSLKDEIVRLLSEFETRNNVLVKMEIYHRYEIHCVNDLTFKNSEYEYKPEANISLVLNRKNITKKEKNR